MKVIVDTPIWSYALRSKQKKFEKLEEELRCFENTKIVDEDYVIAAKFSNECRKKGVQGSHIYFLICSVAFRLEAEIFTTDKDFKHYMKNLPIKLFKIEKNI